MSPKAHVSETVSSVGRGPTKKLSDNEAVGPMKGWPCRKSKQVATAGHLLARIWGLSCPSTFHLGLMQHRGPHHRLATFLDVPVFPSITYPW